MSNSFVDVPEGHPAKKAIERLTDKGYMDKVSDNPMLFNPEEPMSRGDLCKLLVKIDGHNEQGADYTPPSVDKSEFADVPIGVGGHELAEWIHEAVSRGLVEPEDPKWFRPDDPVTRGDIAQLLFLAQTN